jgi:transcriptional regulator with XRE-family HTH domain
VERGPGTRQGGPVRDAKVAFSVGTRIRQLRKRAGLTIEKLADTAGVDGAYLGGVERGLQNPSLRVMAAISRALGVPLPVIVDVENRWSELENRADKELLLEVKVRISKMTADHLRLVIRLLDAVDL